MINAPRTACALLDADEDTISWEHLPDDLLQALRHPHADAEDAAPGTAPEAALSADLRTQSRQAIERTVAQCAGNLSEAARLLGISRNTLYRRLRSKEN